jgi:hypothetical protein
MKQITRSTWITMAALLFALPTAYFISIAVLKYEMNVDGPFDSIAPLLESWGLMDQIGWNINLLILFGPVVGLLLAVFQVLSIHWQIASTEFRIAITIHKKWFPLLVAAFSTSLLGFLFIYMIGENCHC